MFENEKATELFRVATFYKFVGIDDPQALQAQLRSLCEINDVKGTILIAAEGLNATVAASDAGIAAVVAFLNADERFQDLTVKYSAATSAPFQRLKVKVKPEIVTFGAPEASPAVRTGIRIAADDWNAVISDPDVVLIDTRNAYEVAIGSFEGARDPGTRSFAEFKDYVSRELGADRSQRIAMFCTGGIRCEKASSYLLAEGFETVYQLDGGILKYLERIDPEKSLWKGECFVFDERVALTDGVQEGSHRLCACCGHPVKADEDAACAACGRDAPAHSKRPAGVV